jgi:hypothetical protein
MAKWGYSSVAVCAGTGQGWPVFTKTEQVKNSLNQNTI